MNAIVQQSAPVETAARSPLALVPTTAPEKSEGPPSSGHPVTATLNFSANGPAKSNPVWVAPSQRDLPFLKNNTITELKFNNLAEALMFFLPEFPAEGLNITQLANTIMWPKTADKTMCSRVQTALYSLTYQGKVVRNYSTPYRYSRKPGAVYSYKNARQNIHMKPYIIQLKPLGNTTEYLSSACELAIASAANEAQELLPFGATANPLPRVIDAGPVASKCAPKDSSLPKPTIRNFVVELLESGKIHRRDLRALYGELKEIFE